MAKLSDSTSGCLIWAVGLSAFAWFLTIPSSDQVCRSRSMPVFDWLHGVDGQPTCQDLINQLDAQAEEARTKAADLETRLSEVESRLGI